MTASLNIGLFGAGVFGSYYAAKITAHPQCKLAGIYDHNQPRAARLSSSYETIVYDTPQRLIDQADAVVIATPASSHGDYGLSVLQSGKHALIEKPLANSGVQAEKIVTLAKQLNLTLQVGHQERVVVKALGLQSISERPLRIHARRLTRPSNRNVDTDVIFDLMIHDIDLILWLFDAGSDIQINNADAKIRYSTRADWAKTRFHIGQTEILLEASRDAEPLRIMRLDYPSGQIEIDFVARHFTNDTSFSLNADFGSVPAVKDSLATAFDYFVSACLDGTPPFVSGEDALKAVMLAEQIREIGLNQA